MNNQTVVELRDVYKIYKMGQNEVHALDGVSLKINKGEFVSIMGTSGSGKSTMMHIIGALDLPSKGDAYINNKKLIDLSEDELAVIRGKSIGFIFQEFNLIPTLSALENVMLPVLFQDDEHDHTDRCKGLLDLVGLQERKNHKPSELSGGQQQRVAIARALSYNPDIILADEPTGNLDSKASHDIIELLKMSNEKYKQTIIMITHDHNLALNADRIITIDDGKIVSDEKVK